MPSAKPSDSSRFVVDESSFDFRGIGATEIERHLDNLTDTLQLLRAERRGSVSVAPMWDAVQCLDDCELYQFLSGEHASSVDRDTLRRAYSILSKCPEWDEVAAPEIATSISVNGAPHTMALSVAYALAMVLQHRGVACLVFGAINRRGFLAVGCEHGTANVYFFADHGSLPGFWRSLFALEDVSEDEFFSLGQQAFPNIVLHPDLSFRRFDGTYDLLRDRIVTLIGTINDYFATEYQRCSGLPHEIQAALGRYQCDLSPESPNTRRSDKLMRQREVTCDGQTFRCEWHAKIEPHRNRIHFATPDERLSGRILIGLFIDHLDT